MGAGSKKTREMGTPEQNLMKLLEYQIKNIFTQYGIPTPEGRVTSMARVAKRIAEEIAAPVVVKAQVLAEGRGRSGGIRLAKTPEETEVLASQILASHIKDLPVDKVLIDEAVAIDEEYYLLITYDRESQLPVLVMYDTGSINVETAANALYDNLEKVRIDPLIGLQQFQIFDLASRFDFPQKYMRRLMDICLSLWKLFCEKDALLVAVNPLAITGDGRMLALDGKITIDDNAFFRQQVLFDTYNYGMKLSDAESEARKYGMNYFKMNGNIGILANGAGLAMSSMDYIRIRGGQPANYLDMGGTVWEDTAEKAMDLLCADPQVRVIFINIYGGRTQCDRVAAGVLNSLRKQLRRIPVFGSFCGTNAEIALDMLRGSDLVVPVNGMSEAVDRIFDLIGVPAHEHFTE